MKDAAAVTAPMRRYASAHLDAVRGIAALAVLAYHIRYNFFLDYSEVNAPTLFARAFYVATSFGHDAVMVFFVLSGYLISGTILKDLGRHSWSWGRYLLHRMARLYVVLVPGLLLTVFWDSLGLRLYSNHPAYTGAAQQWVNDFFPVQERFTPAIFLANLGFLHAISGIPAFGTAGQLWSLTYEFAYYLMFPAALLAVWPGTSWPARLVCGVATCVLAYHFGTEILLRFPIWLLGLLVRISPQIPGLKRGDPTVRNICVAGLIVAGIALTHTGSARALTGGSVIVADYLIGVIFAVGLYILLQDMRPASATTYVRAASGAAQISYTLYVVHLSLLIFLRAAMIEGRPWTPGPQTVAAAALVFAAIIAYAVGAWYVAEARTDRVREFVAERAVAIRGLLRQYSP